MLTSELLNAHRDVLKEEGITVGLLQKVEKLNAERKDATAKIAWLQGDLDNKTTVLQGRETELEQLREESRERKALLKQLSEARRELEKNSKLQKRNSELQELSSKLRRKNVELQKESELQSTRGNLEEARQCAEMAEAMLESERVAFEEECLEDDLEQALAVRYAAEARVRTVTDQCQWEMKVFKFKKYKDGYEGEAGGATSRYPLEIEDFFESQGMGRPMEPDASIVEARTSLNALSSSIAPPAMVYPRTFQMLVPRFVMPLQT